MKYIFIIIVFFPMLLFSYSLNSISKARVAILKEQVRLEREKNFNEKREIALEKKRKLKKLEAEKKAKRETSNRNAKLANEKYYRDLKRKSRQYNNTSYASTEPFFRKKQFDPNNFKNQAQLKLGDLHILGITSIKPFKNNKLIIKAANGTFALPKDKYEQAEKINFYEELIVK